MVDVHGHITDERYTDVPEVIERAKDKGVDRIVCSAFDIKSSRLAVEFAEKYDCVFANVGIHPENIADFSETAVAIFEDFAQNKKVIAIGEIGLDYHYFDGMTEEEIKQTKDKQKEVFARQIHLANKLGLPIVVHSRDAMGDTIEVLKQNRPLKESMMHCYSGSIESARELMKLNFSFSFGGVVTFNNAKNVRDVVSNLPLERIMLETDCPYMTPVPFRSQRNEPKNVVYVADMISKLHNTTLEEVAAVTTKNAERVFGL